MHSNHFVRHTIMVAAFVLAGCASAPLEDQKIVSSSSSAPARGLGIVAGGAVEDTLKSCLARIPEDASAGQRMVAEQGCQRDQAARGSSQAIPKF